MLTRSFYKRPPNLSFNDFRRSLQVIVNIDFTSTYYNL